MEIIHVGSCALEKLDVMLCCNLQTTIYVGSSALPLLIWNTAEWVLAFKGLKYHKSCGGIHALRALLFYLVPLARYLPTSVDYVGRG